MKTTYFSHNLYISFLLAVVLVSIIPVNAAFLLGDAENGDKLHNSKCVGCHTGLMNGEPQQIYLRDDHRIKTIEGLTGQVNLCNKQINANLDTDQVDDVIIFLNENFYMFE